ncbi:MAG: tetratricopeptide repeat protein, partial [Pseudomonadota bacterium]
TICDKFARSNAIKRASAHHDLAWLAAAFFGKGFSAYWLADNDTARSHYQQALDIYRATGNRSGEADALQGLGNVARMQADNDTARSHFQQALDIYRASGSRSGEAYALRGLGHVARVQDDNDTARSHFQQALDIWQSIGNPREVRWLEGRLRGLD